MATVLLDAQVGGQRGVSIGPGAQSSRLPSPAVSVAVVADSRLFCRFTANGELNVTHSEAHSEIASFKQLNLLFRNVPDPEVLRASIQALTRVGADVVELARLFPERMLDHPSAAVRGTAADAIALSLAGFERDPIYGPLPLPPWDHTAEAAMAFVLIERRLIRETDSTAAAAMLRTLAELPMEPARLTSVEETLSRNVSGDIVRVLGAVSGFEILTRRVPGRAFGFEVSRRLRQFAEGDQVQVQARSVGADSAVELLARLRRLSVLTLHQSGADTDETLMKLAQDPDWQVRRLALTFLRVGDSSQASVASRRLDDSVFQVRAAAIGALSPWMRTTTDCLPLFQALEDANPAVVMAAIAAAPSNCGEHERLIEWLRTKAQGLAAPENWQAPLSALTALVRLRDAAAPALVRDFAATSRAWMVRQHAAELAGTLGDAVTVLKLARDTGDAIGAPLVQAAALRALTRMKHPDRVGLALDVLRSRPTSSGPLFLAALEAIPTTADVALVSEAMERALRGAVLPREVWLALIAKYRQFPIADSPQLRDRTRDADPVVATAAAEALTHVTGSPVAADPHLRAPQSAFYSMPAGSLSVATVTLSDNSSFRVAMYDADAAVSVMRLMTVDASTFFEVAPGVGAQASDRANAVDGTERYGFWRDELSEVPHLRGTLALMADGHDLGNSRVFLNLIDRPDLNHAYTVIGRIISGIDNADKILAGTRIVSMRFSRQ